MTSPQAQLHYRLSDALGAHDPDVDVARRIRNAYMDAGMDAATWDDLPPEIQDLVEQVEKLPRTFWEDPTDRPDDTSYMDDPTDAEAEVDESAIQAPGRRGPYVRIEDAARRGS